MIILLNEIQLAENLGAIARVMGNFSMNELRLISPRVSPSDPKALATSTGAEFILKSAQTYDSVFEATKDIEFLFGTCGDDHRQGIRHYFLPHTAFENSTSEQKIGVLFGCERTGLSQEDLSYCRATIRIPTSLHFSSMNVSHAVAIVAYEWCQKIHQTEGHQMHFGKTKPATQQEKKALFDYLVRNLDAVDYWRVASKKPLMTENLANLFFRMDLTAQEIQTLFGVFDALKH